MGTDDLMTNDRFDPDKVSLHMEYDISRRIGAELGPDVKQVIRVVAETMCRACNDLLAQCVQD